MNDVLMRQAIRVENQYILIAVNTVLLMSGRLAWCTAKSGCHITAFAACCLSKIMPLLTCPVRAEPEGMWALQHSALQPAMLQSYSAFVAKRKGALGIAGAMISVTAVGIVTLPGQHVVQFREIPHPSGLIPRTDKQAGLLTQCEPSPVSLCAPRCRQATCPAVKYTKAQQMLQILESSSR